jgi:hypothetical protein
MVPPYGLGILYHGSRQYGLNDKGPETMNTVEAFNLATQERRQYTLTPRQAVIAAYAQSLGDMNTWDYGKYSPMVCKTSFHYFLGDWGARHIEGEPMQQ